MPRASMIVKDILATLWGVHATPRPSHAATFTHSYQRICAAKIYSIAFAPPHSRRLIHAVLMRPHSRHTYAAALTPHLCSSIDAAALKLPRPHRTYSAALTPPHLCCSSHAASFLPPHSRRRLHWAASMLPLSHPCIHAAARMLQHSRRCILSPLSRRRIDAVALTMPYLCRRIHASACTPPFLCRRMPQCTPPHSRRSHAAALMPSLSRRSIGAAALMLPPRTPQHFSVATSRRQPHAAAFMPRIYAAASAQQHLRCSFRGALCRWKRTTWSAFFNAKHDAGGREPAREGAGPKKNPTF